jgi:predicted GTPase
MYGPDKKLVQVLPGTEDACYGADGSRRAFYKQLVKVVQAADVVIEVLDARDPLSSRCPDVERFVRQSGVSKKLILLLNKIGGCLFSTEGFPQKVSLRVTS